jgi:hypothetical protein
MSHPPVSTRIRVADADIVDVQCVRFNDNDVTAENNRVAINFGLTMVGGGATGALGAALFPTFLAASDSVLLAGAASGVTSDVAFQGYQNALFVGSGGDYGRSGFDSRELALSAAFGALPGVPAAIRGWADDLRGLGVPDWNIRLSRPGTLYSNGTGLELERIGSTVGNGGGTAGASAADAVGDAVNNGIPTRLYHYTNEPGLNGIVESGQLNPSLKALNPNDVRYGNGQYLSDIAPGTMTPAQLSRQFINNPFQGARYTHFVEIDTTGLDIIQGRPGVYVVPNEVPLDLTGRLTNSGKVGP